MRQIAIILAALLALAGCAQTPVARAPGGASVNPAEIGGGEPSATPEDSKVTKVGEWATAEDGVEFTVLSLARSRVSDVAAGGRVGHPAVVVTVQIKNGSKDRLDLSQIDLSVRLGPDGRESEQVYQGDFAGTPDGTLAPKRKSTSRYLFDAKNVAELRTVSVELSPGWDYNSITFEGRA